MKRLAISITELLVGVAILSILAGTMALSPDLYKRSTKREAERVYAILTNHMLKADRTKVSFKVIVEEKRIKIIGQNTNIAEAKQTEYFEAGPGCSYSPCELFYSYVQNTFTKAGTITVIGKGNPYKITIATIGGRIRLTP